MGMCVLFAGFIVFLCFFKHLSFIIDLTLDPYFEIEKLQ